MKIINIFLSTMISLTIKSFTKLTHRSLFNYEETGNTNRNEQIRKRKQKK